MYKKNINKKVSYISTYVILGIIVMGIMFISPNLNKNIYAASSYAGNPNYAQPFSITPATNENAFRTAEYKKEQEALNKLYDLVGSKPTSIQEYKNLNYAETAEANQAKFTIGSDYSLNVDTRGAFETTGKMFDPVGNTALHEGNVSGYSAAEWIRDPGVFCIDPTTPITGVADDSRGRDASNRAGTVRESSSINSATNWANGTGVNNRTFNNVATVNLINNLVQNNNLSEDHAIQMARQLRDRVENVDNQISNGVSLIGQDVVHPEGTLVNQFGNNNVETTDNRITDSERSNLIAQFGSNGAQTNVSTSGQQYIRANGNVQQIANNLSTTVTTDAPNTTRATNNPVLSNEVQTSDGEVDTQTRSVLRYEAPILDNEAYLAFIVTAYQQRAYASDQFTKISDSALQAAVWRTPVSGSGRDENSEVRASWLNTDTTGINVNDNSLNAEALAFQKYWTELKNFANSKGPFPNDGYQRFLKGKAYHADVQITKSFDSQQDVPDEELIINNPKIKYEPRILPGDGSTMEKSSVVNFDTNTQKWLIGPYKVDYLLATNGKEGNSDTVETDIEMKKYFSGITKVSLFGKYREDQGQTPQVTNTQGYAPTISTVPPRTDGTTTNSTNTLTNNQNTTTENTNTNNNEVVNNTNNNVRLTLLRSHLHKKGLSLNAEFELYNQLAENVENFLKNDEYKFNTTLVLDADSNKNTILVKKVLKAFIEDYADALYPVVENNFSIQLQNKVEEGTNKYVGTTIIVNKKGYLPQVKNIENSLEFKAYFNTITYELAKSTNALGNISDAQKVRYVNEIAKRLIEQKDSNASEYQWKNGTLEEKNYFYSLLVQNTLGYLNIETSRIRTKVIDQTSNSVGKNRIVNIVKIDNKWYTLDVLENSFTDNYLLLAGRNTFLSKYELDKDSLFNPLYDAHLVEVNDYVIQEDNQGLINRANANVANFDISPYNNPISVELSNKTRSEIERKEKQQEQERKLLKELEKASSSSDEINAYGRPTTLSGSLVSGNPLLESESTVETSDETSFETPASTSSTPLLGGPVPNTVPVRQVLPVRNEVLTVLPERELLDLEKDEDKFNTKQEEEQEGLKVVKEWRMKINRTSDVAQNTPGMAAEGNASYGIPAPNEEFFFEIDYDPSLVQVSKARFEFAYIIFGGNRREYQLYKGKLKDIKVTTTTNIGLQEQVFDYIHYSENEEGEIVESVQSEVGYVPTQTRNINVSFNEAVQQEQSQMSIEALRWVEEVAVEIRFTTPEIPPTPEPKKLNLLVPIGGRVWEDRQDLGTKHVGYDNVYGGNSVDRDLEGIRVTIFRNFVKWDENRVPIEIIKREYARLFDQNGNETGIKELFTDKNGRYGTYYIHDIGFTEDEYLNIAKKDTTTYGVTFSVRWDYDGITYEPVTPLQLPDGNIEASNVIEKARKFNESTTEEKSQYENSSFGFENKLVRARYNQANATIAGSNPIDANGQTIGKTIPANFDTVSNTAKLPEFANENGRQITYSKYSDENIGGVNPTGISRVRSGYDTVIPQNRRSQGIEPTSNEWVNEFINATTLEIGLKLPANEKIRFEESEDLTIDQAFNEFSGKYFAANKYMENINLGLRRRKPIDLTLKKTLNNASLFVNKKAYNYSFSDLNNDMLTEAEKQQEGLGYNINFTQKAAARDANKVNQVLDLYKTDYIYRTSMYSGDQDLYNVLKAEIASEKMDDILAGGNTTNNLRDPRQLDVYVTYRLEATNNSSVDTVEVNAIDDYYNANLELVDKQVQKTIETDPIVNGQRTTLENTEVANAEIALQRQEVEIPHPAYKVSSKHTEVPKVLDTIGTNGVSGMNTVKLDNQASNEVYKQNMNLPEIMNVSRLSRTENNPILLLPDQRADIYLTFRVKNASDIVKVKEHAQNIGEDAQRNLGDLYEHVGTGNGITTLTQALSLGDFENVAEIARFTSYDTLTGNTSAKVDETSAPDNVDLTNVRNALVNKSSTVVFEDDTDSAPIITIKVETTPEGKNLTRTLSGTVFEDQRNINNKGIATGDGQFDPTTEAGIKKHPVTLEERISINAQVAKTNAPNILFNNDINDVDFIDIPFIWPNQIKAEGIELDLAKVTGFESTVETNDNGVYEFKGIPAGNMVASLDYTSPRDKTAIFTNKNGKDSINAIQEAEITKDDLVETANSANREVKYYNGMDFKSTMFYSQGGRTDVNGDPTNYEKPLNIYTTWLDKDKNSSNNSYLRDDEGRRIQVTAEFEELTNDNVKYVNLFRTNNSLSGVTSEDDFKEKLNKAHQLSSMRATTPKMNFSIEHYELLKNSQNGENTTKSTLLTQFKDLYAVEGNYANSGQSQVKTSNIGYNVTNINLGLVERPKTKVVMNKEVKNITLTTADGKTPININFIPKARVENVPNNGKLIYGTSILGENIVHFDREIDTQTSVGTEFLMNLDRSSFVDGVATGNPSDILKAGFRYINIDKSLLQDSTISIKYGVYAYNLGELDRKIDLNKAVSKKIISADMGVDAFKESIAKFREKAYRVGKNVGDGTLNTQIDPDTYGHGAYLGLPYYMIDNSPEVPLDNNELSGIKVGTVMDLVDTSTDVNKDDEINKNWTPADKDDLVGLVQNIENNDADIINSNGESYIQDLGAALAGNNSTTNNTSTTTAITSTSASKPKEDSNVKSRVFLLHQNEIEIKPATSNGEIKFDGSTKNTNNDYKVEWEIKTDKTLSSQTDSSDLVFENIIELLKYTSGTGRSDYTIPGNVIPQLDKENEVGKGVVPGNDNENGVILTSEGNVINQNGGIPTNNVQSGIDVTDRTFKATTIEHDSASSETVRASEPTGLSEMTTANRVAILVTIITIGIAVTVLLITDTKKSKK